MLRTLLATCFAGSSVFLWEMFALLGLSIAWVCDAQMLSRCLRGPALFCASCGLSQPAAECNVNKQHLDGCNAVLTAQYLQDKTPNPT